MLGTEKGAPVGFAVSSWTLSSSDTSSSALSFGVSSGKFQNIDTAAGGKDSVCKSPTQESWRKGIAFSLLVDTGPEKTVP